MKKIGLQERNCDAALGLAWEYYGDNSLKKGDARPTKLVDFEGIAKHHNVNIMLFEPNKDKGKNEGSVKIQQKNGLPTINMGLLGGHCFYMKKMDVLCNRWECKVVGRYLREKRT